MIDWGRGAESAPRMCSMILIWAEVTGAYWHLCTFTRFHVCSYWQLKSRSVCCWSSCCRCWRKIIVWRPNHNKHGVMLEESVCLCVILFHSLLISWTSPYFRNKNFIFFSSWDICSVCRKHPIWLYSCFTNFAIYLVYINATVYWRTQYACTDEHLFELFSLFPLHIPDIILISSPFCQCLAPPWYNMQAPQL